jgi:anti-anti-sigma regulatory factor
VSLTKTVAEIAPGDHACAVVDSDEQHWEVAAGYVSAGLVRREKVVYFDGEGSAEPLLRRLREADVNVDEAVDTGQLVVLPPEAADASDERATEAVRSQVRESIEDALREGYRAVRLTDEPSAESRAIGHSAVHRLGELDRMIHEVVRDRPVTMLCQYDRRHWSSSDLHQLGELHPVEVIAPALYDDGLLRVTRRAPFSTRVCGEIDFSNRDLVRGMIENELERALRATNETGEVAVHLESLRFADVTSVAEFVQAAEGFPQSHRLVLYGVQPSVRRLLDRCGAAFSSQLEIRDRLPR